ncbi:hypothetical protein RHGRI_013574 [Rhododendron griersonianum]|uniref:S-protein homolog n=1 Tax=Rhododendron griersonianum TaxID=479676 RepID=A0AAV6K649_9ERIC|nr:hypothetical protein RHGRI_013574 [Rhododendron griersonianum]
MQTLCEPEDTKTFFKITVHINCAVQGQVRFRCQSSDDNLGNQTLNTGQYYSFYFYRFYNTIFFYHFYWNSKDRSFDVYAQCLAATCLHGLLSYDCFWRVEPGLTVFILVMMTRVTGLFILGKDIILCWMYTGKTVWFLS